MKPGIQELAVHNENKAIYFKDDLDRNSLEEKNVSTLIAWMTLNEMEKANPIPLDQRNELPVSYE